MTVDSRAHALWRPLRAFLRLESASGILLLACAAAALLWTNTSWSASYHALKEFSVGWGRASFSLELFVNDGLMTVFFLLVGLEIKREILSGELASWRRSALPLAGALGGMLAPAAIFLLWNRGKSGAHGWGVPMATDIAFVMGALALLGKRIPSGLKVFLVALAILDDIGAILVIAFFYAGRPNAAPLFAALLLLAGLAFLNLAGVRRLWPYLMGGAALWAALFHSGVHATLAGVLLAFCIPHRAGSAEAESPLRRLETRLHPWVNFGILPLFALVNAGVGLSGGALRGLGTPLGLGIVTGLCLGKPVGIALFSWLAVRLRFAALPSGVRWGHMLGAGLLGGIGFTMSLFIAGIGLSPEFLENAKLAVLAASLLAGAAGYAFLRLLAAPGSRA